MESELVWKCTLHAANKNYNLCTEFWLVNLLEGGTWKIEKQMGE